MIETIISGHTILVDDEDRELLSKFPWNYGKAGLSYPSGKNTIYFSRLVMDCPDDMEVDHINHNRWDNRRTNLRLATRTENSQNNKKRESYNGKICSSQFKGVCWKVDNHCWVARITINGIRVHLGYFYLEIEAAKAYNKAAKKYHKEFAVLNEINGEVL